MSVPVAMEDVHTHVQTQLAASGAHADLVSD